MCPHQSHVSFNHQFQLPIKSPIRQYVGGDWLFFNFTYFSQTISRNTQPTVIRRIWVGNLRLVSWRPLKRFWGVTRATEWSLDLLKRFGCLASEGIYGVVEGKLVACVSIGAPRPAGGITTERPTAQARIGRFIIIIHFIGLTEEELTKRWRGGRAWPVLNRCESVQRS